MKFASKKGENIADLGGIKMAHRAYSKETKSNNLKIGSTWVHLDPLG